MAAQARGQLRDIEARFAAGASAQAVAAELNVLARRIALSTDARGRVARLNGQAWLDYLAAVTADESVKGPAGRVFTEAPYRSDALPPELAARFDDHFANAVAILDRWLDATARGPRPGE